MSYSKAKIWARRIHDGAYIITDVPEENQTIVRRAYFDLYGEEI